MDRSANSTSVQAPAAPPAGGGAAASKPASGRLPKGERRVRFADTMGMELASIFLFDLINQWYISSSHTQRALRPAEPRAGATTAALLATSNQLARAGHHHHLDHNLNHGKQHPLANNNSFTYNYNHNYHKSYQQQKQQCQQQSHLHQQHAYHLAGDADNSAYSYANFSSTQASHYNYQGNSSSQQHAHQSRCQSPTAKQANPQHHQLYSNHHHHHHTHNNHQPRQQQPQPQQAKQPSFICEFTQPISLISFKERVKMNKVQLETCQVSAGPDDAAAAAAAASPAPSSLSVSCTARVLNLSYDKSVMVRYTTDDWHTHTDCPAAFKPGSCDGWSDRFAASFTIAGEQARAFQPGQRIIFAIRYIYNGDQIHWDNNGGLNYAIKKLH